MHVDQDGMIVAGWRLGVIALGEMVTSLAREILLSSPDASPGP
ncbi:MAG TPA: hypothetical protein VEX37_11950 [Thermomicrobiales bacterium]|nr:hypothetical protein [Thermomicrobiales bacterium]